MAPVGIDRLRVEYFDPGFGTVSAAFARGPFADFDFFAAMFLDLTLALH
jgi:hypothetical protein